MKNVMSSKIIVECNGLPGCGKSTLISALAYKLEENKIAVQTSGVATFRAQDKNFFVKNTVKLLRMSSILNNDSFKLFHEVRSERIAAGKRTTLDRESLILIAYLQYLRNAYKKGSGIVLADEGIVQTITALFQFCRNRELLAERYLGGCEKKELMIVNCLIRQQETEKRICKRNRHDSSIDELSGSELKDYLADYDAFLSRNRALLNCRQINIDMEESIEDGVEVLYREMRMV